MCFLTNGQNSEKLKVQQDLLVLVYLFFRLGSRLEGRSSGDTASFFQLRFNEVQMTFNRLSQQWFMSILSTKEHSFRSLKCTLWIFYTDDTTGKRKQKQFR